MEYCGRPGAACAISTSPPVTCSSPPRMRSIVVLPQPEGPTIAKNVPSSMSSDTSSMATSVRNRLIRCLMRILTGRLPPMSAGERDGAKGVPAARLEALSDIEIHRADLQDTRGRVDRDRKEHADRHHYHLRHLAEAEDQQDERQDRAFRNRIGGDNQWIDQRPHRPRDAHRDAENDRRN